MVNYVNSASKALKLITKFGKSFTLRHSSGGTYQASDNTFNGATTTNYTIKAVILKETEERPDNTPRTIRKRKLLIAASGLAVSVNLRNCKILDGLDTWTIKDVQVFAPAGTTIFYKAEVTR